jgi:hypothetical protein
MGGMRCVSGTMVDVPFGQSNPEIVLSKPGQLIFNQATLYIFATGTVIKVTLRQKYHGQRHHWLVGCRNGAVDQAARNCEANHQR